MTERCKAIQKSISTVAVQKLNLLLTEDVTGAGTFKGSTLISTLKVFLKCPSFLIVSVVDESLKVPLKLTLFTHLSIANSTVSDQNDSPDINKSYSG